MRMCNAIAALIYLYTLLFGVLGLPPQKIVGGTYSSPDEFPHQVSIRLYGQHICGGSIISTRHILTAAHCLFEYINIYNEITVVSGTTNLYSGGEHHNIQSFRIHPSFINDEKYDFPNDIAVILLKTPIKIDHSNHIVKLASKSDYGGLYGVVSGWGKISYSEEKTFPYLLKLVTNVINATYCQQIIGRTIYNSQVCALASPASGTCQGDSGGPLIVGNELVGIVSFGFQCAAGIPDVYTSVYAYRPFIEQVIKESGLPNDILYPPTYPINNVKKTIIKVQNPTSSSTNTIPQINKIYYLLNDGQWFQVRRH